MIFFVWSTVRNNVQIEQEIEKLLSTDDLYSPCLAPFLLLLRHVERIAAPPVYLPYHHLPHFQSASYSAARQYLQRVDVTKFTYVAPTS